MKGYKFVKVNTDELLHGTGVVIDLGVETSKIVICRDLKELTVFPYVEEEL